MNRIAWDPFQPYESLQSPSCSFSQCRWARWLWKPWREGAWILNHWLREVLRYLDKNNSWLWPYTNVGGKYFPWSLLKAEKLFERLRTGCCKEFEKEIEGTLLINLGFLVSVHIDRTGNNSSRMIWTTKTLPASKYVLNSHPVDF